MRYLVWLFEEKSLESVLRRLFKSIIFVVGVLGYFTGFSLFISYILKSIYKEAILITMSGFNTVLILISIPIIIVSIILYLRLRGITRIGIDLNKKYKRIKNISMILSVIFLILEVYSLGNYILVYKDKIVVKNSIISKDTIYDYGDIEEVNIFIEKTSKTASMRYEIIFKDNQKIKIDNNLIEYNLLNKIEVIDEIIKEKNINRNVNDDYLSKVLSGINKKEKEQYLNLFEE